MQPRRKLGRGLEDFSHLFLSSPTEGVAEPSRATSPPVICIAADRKVTERAFLTLEMARAIAQRGKRVLLLDADFSHPRLWMLEDAPAPGSILGVISGNGAAPPTPECADGVKLITLDVDVSGLGCLPASRRASLARWFAAAEEEADILLVAASPALTRHTIAVLKACHDVVVVTPQHANDVVDAYGVIKTVVQVNGEARLGIVASRIDTPDRSAAVFGRMQRIVARFLGKSLHNCGYIPADKWRGPAPSSQIAPGVAGISQAILQMDGEGEERPAGANHRSLAQRLFTDVA